MHPQLLITDRLQTVTDDEGALTSPSAEKLVGDLFLEKPFYLKLRLVKRGSPSAT